MTELEQPASHSTNNLFSDVELDTKKAEMDAKRVAAEKMMQDIRDNLVRRQLTTEDAIVHKGWDIQCFFPRQEDPNRIIHFQLYAVEKPSRIGTIDFRIREMDKEKMLEARQLTSIGNEETAVTHYIFPNEQERKKRDKGPTVFTQLAITMLIEQVLQRKPSKTVSPR
jgi:hypothetical protein